MIELRSKEAKSAEALDSIAQKVADASARLPQIENGEDGIPKLKLAFLFTPLSFPGFWEGNWLLDCSESSLCVTKPETLSRNMPYRFPPR